MGCGGSANRAPAEQRAKADSPAAQKGGGGKRSPRVQCVETDVAAQSTRQLDVAGAIASLLKQWDAAAGAGQLDNTRCETLGTTMMGASVATPRRRDKQNKSSRLAPATSNTNLVSPRYQGQKSQPRQQLMASRRDQSRESLYSLRSRGPRRQPIVSEILNVLADQLGDQDVLREVTGWEHERQMNIQTTQAQQHNASFDSITSPVTPAVDARDAPEGVVAFVFTDIANSTALWEQVPEAMDDALSIHNVVARRALEDCGGFEVKTIGDAFMCAFREAKDAMRFCLSVQEELVEQDWPEELIDCQPAATVESGGKKVYHGLRVRMGCHVGEVIKEINPTTGRADYRGTTVNIAARVEGQGVGGQVMVTGEVRQAIQNDLDTLDNPAISSAGQRSLKGVAKAVELFAVVPASLSVRFQLAKQAKQEHQPDLKKIASSAFGQTQMSGLGKALGMRMRRGYGTVCHVRPCTQRDPALDDAVTVLDRQCDLIRMLSMDVAATEGFLETVSGDSLLCAWNTTRACMAHFQQALRFAGLLHARCNPTHEQFGFCAAFGVSPPDQQLEANGGSGNPHERTLFGVASGKLLQGTVGTARQRFRSIIGNVERVAAALADNCPAFGCRALVSQRTVREWHRDRPSESEGGILSHLRPVDVWEVAQVPDMLVEQADLITLARAEREFGVWEFLSDAAAAGMGGGEAVASQDKKQRVKARKSLAVPGWGENFFPAMAGNEQALEALERLADNGSPTGDRTVHYVVKLIRAHVKSGAAEGRARRVLESLTPFNTGEQTPQADRGLTSTTDGSHPASSVPPAAKPQSSSPRLLPPQ